MKNQFRTVVLVLLLAASVTACKKKGGASGGGVGVPECDDYLAKMDACAKKVGNKGGEGLTKMAAMMRKSWAEDVNKPELKKEMPKTCTTAISDMQKQMPDCDWGAGAAPAAPAAAPADPAAAPADPAAAPAPEGSAAAAPAGSAAP